MGTDIKPIVKKIDDNVQGLKSFHESLVQNTSEKEQDILLQFPTVYIHNWKNTGDYEVYIGESNNIIQRTKQHYDVGIDESKWQHQLLLQDASLYIIGHEHFNKSMTLDIENRLMLYMMSVDRVRKIHNLRGNPQSRYYPDSEMDDIFQMIWKKLRKDNKELFPSESAIKDSAVFKASPLHKLTEEQEAVKLKIIQRVFEALQTGKRGQLIFIEGEAGTGKTVLNSSTFYEIFASAEEQEMEPLKCCMMVNHDEQITVYEQIARKLGLVERYGEVVYKPTSFINRHSVDEPIDVAFIDEAHLLLTQGKQSYQGENQLKDIIERARVTVVMFDENQILTTEQYWEAQILSQYRELDRELGKQEKRANKYMSWAEQPQTIDEIGSTFTIQGFDLNYAGVILGSSVKYRNGEVIFDPSASYNSKTVRNRTLSDGSKQKFGEELIQHEVRVLMTRGVEGLYIYACDDALREALLQAMK